MYLEDYLKIHAISPVEFAKKFRVGKKNGIDPSTISNYKKGKRFPSGPIAAEIERLTGGKVTIHDLKKCWEEKQKNG
jgi:DNA-binding transcriptional regulator YdaS (Cro superfamily)